LEFLRKSMRSSADPAPEESSPRLKPEKGEISAEEDFGKGIPWTAGDFFMERIGHRSGRVWIDPAFL
jgi:hypothetical protein